MLFLRNDFCSIHRGDYREALSTHSVYTLRSRELLIFINHCTSDQGGFASRQGQLFDMQKRIMLGQPNFTSILNFFSAKKRQR